MGKRALGTGMRSALGGWGGVYDPKLALAFCLALSAVLWWIPVLGAATAGYVCGRKAGSVTLGTACSAAAGAIVLGAVSAASAITGGAPYLDPFYSSGSLDLSNLGVTVAFGFVGGVLSRQARKETADLLAAGACDFAVRPAARSIALHRRGKALGFESFEDCMASQAMSVNRNPGSTREPAGSARRDAPGGPDHEAASPRASGPQYTPTRSGEGRSPFSDILERQGGKR
ncbi:MAG: hypothetical protein LBG62_05465 [Candidatus Methanoplasma sp.]|jgi:hypothetical protein|nr:hypothetical protein [Candidatus Methanoplasma sp.]